METIMNDIVSLAWLQTHFHFVVLAAFMVLQWIVLQAFIIHYFTKRTVIPTFGRERGRIEMLEKLVGFQSNQMERLYAKVAELHREIQTVGSQSREQARNTSHGETSMISLGEVTLKKRLAELEQKGQA